MKSYILQKMGVYTIGTETAVISSCLLRVQMEAKFQNFEMQMEENIILAVNV